MDSIKRCRTLIAGNISAFNAFLSALEGRIKQASVVISSNLGGDDMLDLISGGASSDAIRNAMRSGLNNMNNEEDCKSIVNELKTDPKFVDGLNDLGAKTVVNSPILYTNDNPISKHPNPGLEQFDFERHIKELEAANRNRPRVLMQQEYDRIMRPDLFRGGIYIPSQYQNQKKVRQ
jgi:hypothetical protein